MTASTSGDASSVLPASSHQIAAVETAGLIGRQDGSLRSVRRADGGDSVDDPGSTGLYTARAGRTRCSSGPTTRTVAITAMSPRRPRCRRATSTAAAGWRTRPDVCAGFPDAA